MSAESPPLTDERVELYHEHLEGLDYSPVVRDCFELVRDFYADNFDIAIPRYPVPNDWNADELDLIGPLSEAAGFVKVGDWNPATLRPADLLAVAVGTARPSHLAIVLSGNRLLHHPLHRRSRVEPWAGFWQMGTLYVLRHPKVPNLTPAKTDTSIEELNRARYFG